MVFEDAGHGLTGRMCGYRVRVGNLAARGGRRIMTTNIALALAIIVGLFPLALFGVLGLAGVVVIHEAAEVVVILSGIRAARHPKETRLPTAR